MSKRRRGNRKRRNHGGTRDEPAELDWITVDGRRMFVVGYTPGGAPYGSFEDEMDDAFDGITEDPFA